MSYDLLMSQFISFPLLLPLLMVYVLIVIDDEHKYKHYQDGDSEARSSEPVDPLMDSQAKPSCWVRFMKCCFGGSGPQENNSESTHRDSQMIQTNRGANSKSNSNLGR